MWLDVLSILHVPDNVKAEFLQHLRNKLFRGFREELYLVALH